MKTLSNGVRLVFVPMEGVESVSVSVFVGCGGRYESDKVAGISHFLEHMVFKGTKSFPTYDDVHVVERLGGAMNAYTDIDATKFYAKVLSVDWKVTLDVISDLVLSPLLPQKEFDPERKVIIEEMAMHEDDLPWKAEEVYHQLTFSGSSLGTRIIGTRESLMQIDRDVMSEFRKKMYKSGNIVVVISGKITEKEKIESRVKELFESLPASDNGGFTPFRDGQDKSRVIVIEKPKAEQANLIMGFKVCGRLSDDKYPLQVLNLILGSGFTSRLYRKIREEKGLCYSIYSGMSNYSEIGEWSVSAGLNLDRLDEAIDEILAQLKLFLDKGADLQEVETAKKRFSAAAAFQMESPDRLGEFYGRQVLMGEKVLTVHEYLERITSVTASQVLGVARKYFDMKKINLALVGKYKKEKAEEQLLKRLGFSGH